MKNRNVKLAIIIMLITVVGLFAQVPRTLSYQGKLTNPGGNVITTPVNITFSIFNVVSGGTALWTETHSSVPVTNGLFDVTLGVTTPINLPFDEPYWIELTVDGEPLEPREKMAAVPYAHRAVYAEDGPSNWTLSGDDIYNNNSGNVGIGTSSPDASAILDVSSTESGILYPRMTTAQREAISSPATSLLIYNTTTGCIETYIDGEWQKMWCDGDLPTNAFCDGYIYIGNPDGGLNYNKPFNASYKHNRCCMLFKRDEMPFCRGGEITEISIMIWIISTYYTFTNVHVYMMETELEALSSDPGWYEGTEVWSGDWGLNTGWRTFTLTTPFRWDEDNLIISFKNYNTSTGGSYSYQLLSAIGTGSVSDYLTSGWSTSETPPSSYSNGYCRPLIRLTFSGD